MNMWIDRLMSAYSICSSSKEASCQTTLYISLPLYIYVYIYTNTHTHICFLYMYLPIYIYVYIHLHIIYTVLYVRGYIFHFESCISYDTLYSLLHLCSIYICMYINVYIYTHTFYMVSWILHIVHFWQCPHPATGQGVIIRAICLSNYKCIRTSIYIYYIYIYIYIHTYIHAYCNHYPMVTDWGGAVPILCITYDIPVSSKTSLILGPTVKTGTLAKLAEFGKQAEVLGSGVSPLGGPVQCLLLASWLLRKIRGSCEPC